MSRPAKILLAIATLWPILYLFGFMLLVFGTVLAGFGSGRAGMPLGGPEGFMVLFTLHGLTMLWVVGLTIFYVVHLFKTERIPADKKALWAVVLLLANLFAMPVYWYLYVWCDPEGAA